MLWLSFCFYITLSRLACYVKIRSTLVACDLLLICKILKAVFGFFLNLTRANGYVPPSVRHTLYILLIADIEVVVGQVNDAVILLYLSE